MDDFGLEARVDDLAAVIRHLDLRRFALAGVDHGAAIAMAYAARHPESVSSLILMSPWRLGAQRHSLPAFRMVSTAVTPASHQEWDLFVKVVGNLVTNFENVDVSRRVAEMMQGATSPANLAAYNVAAKRFDLTEALPRIAVRALVLHEPPFPFRLL